MRYAVALHERLLTVVDRETGHARAPKAANRGTIKGISSKSRYRLIKFLSQISRPDEPVFITLTYRNFSDSFKDWKRHLHNFRRVVADEFPDYCGIWRLEFQKRGAPHFHILAWLVREVPLDWLQTRLSEIWCRVIGQQSEANKEYGVTVEPCTDFRRSAFYISVYQAKDSQDRDDIQTGREWGHWKKDRLGLEPIRVADLDRSGVLLLRRVLRRHYVSFMRVSGRKPKAYLRALRRDQPFSNFLPFAQSRRLLEWVGSEQLGSECPAIDLGEPSPCKSINSCSWQLSQLLHSSSSLAVAEL